MDKQTLKHKYFTRDYFVYADKPAFIFGGDLNYTRCPSFNWRDRMLKMRAAGLNTVTVYATWAFHESAEGEWDFSGDHDLGHYCDIAHELGLGVILRMGPFIHAEHRNGGLPQWVIDKLRERARTNDPEYLRIAGIWYEKLLEIALPRLFCNGGPIIMLQAENELGSAGSKGDDIPRGSSDPDENAKHIMYFLGILQKHGVDVPILDINVFPGRENIEYLITAGGMYIVNCFGCEGEFQPIDLSNWENHDKPLITIETIGGMFPRFFDWPYYSNTNSYQGPLVKPEYIETITYQHLAEGYNGINYYVFADGQHTDNGGERMIPTKDMNFQAPITVTGSLRESYRSVKRIGWFLRSFEQEVAGSKPVPTWMQAKSHGQAHPGATQSGDLFEGYHAQSDLADSRGDFTTDVKSMGRVTKGLNLGESNFAFLFNTLTRGTQWKRDIRLTTNPQGIPCELYSEYPRRVQLSLPPQRNKCLPFYVKLDSGKFLEYSTAELLDRRSYGNGVQLILHADADETVETRLVLPEKSDVKSQGESLAHWESPNTLMLIGIPGENYQINIIDNENPLRVILMERNLAGCVWDIAAPGSVAVAASNFVILESKFEDGKTRALVQISDPDFYLHIFDNSPLRVESSLLKINESYNSEFGVYEASGEAMISSPAIDFSKERKNRCWVWQADLSPELLDGLHDLVLNINYDGENARAYLNDNLISDHYYGRFLAWEVGLKNVLKEPGSLRLEFEHTRSVDMKTVPIVETWIDIVWE